MNATLTEEKFYSISDAVDKIVENKDDVTRGWFPTVEEMKCYKADSDNQEYVQMILYFASNPLANMFKDEDELAEKYNETVEFCRKLSTEIEFAPEDTDETTGQQLDK